MYNDKVFKALADQTRRSIVNLLRKKEMTAGEIANNFDISKPSISEHLKILKNADLVESEKKGQYVIYFLNTTILEEVISYLLRIMKPAENKGGYK